jgi:putative membrane protein
MWWDGGMWLYPLVLLTILLVGFYLIFGRSDGRSPRSRDGSETALDIFNKRYARGDLSKAEYEQIKKDLVS